MSAKEHPDVTRKVTENHQFLEYARTLVIAPEVMKQLEDIFRIHPSHLHGIESQKRFLATVHLVKRECPWCDSAVSYFEAIKNPAEYNLGNLCEHECPHCHKRLVQCVPFMGGGQTWTWRKHEDDKNPNRAL